MEMWQRSGGISSIFLNFHICRFLTKILICIILVCSDDNAFSFSSADFPFSYILFKKNGLNILLFIDLKTYSNSF